MTIRKILRLGDPVLRQIAAPVETFATPELHQFIADMFETMEANDGAGLAAIQIGEPVRIMVFGIAENTRYPDAPEITNTVLINPTITPLSDEVNDGWEGCLSVPGMQGIVPRYSHIRYEGFDQSGNRIEGEAEEFHARVIQHEYDHLEGILYPERIKNMKLFGFLEEFEKTQSE